MKLIQIVDSLEYIKTNCWQRQLFNHLTKQATCHGIITLSELRTEGKLLDSDVILLTLKLRSLARERNLLRSRLGDRRVFIYEQDPWENFIDQGSCHGTYEWCRENLNVDSFILTSKWWADYVASQGFKTMFAQMWLDPSLCDYGIPWRSRPITVGFMGTLHTYRKHAIDELMRMGITVQVFPPGTYDEYLQRLTQMQFFFHWEDDAGWTIDGKPVKQNALWAKEIEIAGRGCFPLRLYEPESESYCVASIPGILTYTTLSRVPSIIQMISSDNDLQARLKCSVDFIRSHKGWFELDQLR